MKCLQKLRSPVLRRIYNDRKQSGLINGVSYFLNILLPLPRIPFDRVPPVLNVTEVKGN